MAHFQNILRVFFLFFLLIQPIAADTPYFLDFKFILNQSDAGKKAQSFLKTKLDKGIKNLKDKEKKLQQEEKKIIEQKKILSTEEYKKVSELRNKVTSLQKEKIHYCRLLLSREQKQEMNY